VLVGVVVHDYSQVSSFIHLCVCVSWTFPAGQLENCEKIKKYIYSGESTNSKASFVENMYQRFFCCLAATQSVKITSFLIIFTIKKITPSDSDILSFLFVCHRKMCGSIMLNVHH